MKKLLAVIFLVGITFLGNSYIYGAINVKNNNVNSVSNIVNENNNVSTKEIEEYFDGLLGIGSIKDIDVKSFFLNPFELLWLFFKAVFIVVAINMVAHIVCKGAFSYSDILKRRIKARRLNKVLRDIYD